MFDSQASQSRGGQPVSYLVDVLLVLFLIYQTYMGWRSGFFAQVTALASIGFGVMVGTVLAPSLGARLLGVVTENHFHAKLMAFLLVMAMVCFLLRIATVYAEARSEEGVSKGEREKRKRDDRVLGSVFGALKGSVVILVLLAGLAGLAPELGIWQQSCLAPPLATAGRRLLPDDAPDRVQEWLERSKEEVCEGLQLRAGDKRKEERSEPSSTKAESQR